MKVCVDCGDNHENEYEHCDNCIEAYEQADDDQVAELAALNRKVEEMQKTLEWYADEKNYELFDANVTEYSYETTSAIWEDEGERARQALKGDPK